MSHQYVWQIIVHIFVLLYLDMIIIEQFEPDQTTFADWPVDIDRQARRLFRKK